MTLIRTEAFVPLISTPPAARGERTDFQATVLSQPEQTRKFQAVESSAPSAGAGATPRAVGCEPRITLQRDGEQVAGIRIECSCGQVIDLACVYPAEPKA